jgi:DNA polymerase II large subunit
MAKENPNTEMSESMQHYTDSIFKDVERAYVVAERARKKGYDPEHHVDIPLAKNLSERVEGLISAVAPQIKGKGIPERIQELEEKYGKLDWRVALQVSLEVAQQKFCTFQDNRLAMETGIRIGIAYLTLGVVASPLEGFVELKFKKRKDGKEYFALMYSGPIRSAGGTAGAVSLLVADYIRTMMGYHPYDATEDECKRAVTELYDYHDRITNLQYLPSEEEILFLMQHIPVQIDGDPSEDIEVSNYKDLSRIETNRIRSGMCLVTGECIAQKASKVWTQLNRWGKDFQLEHWNFLKEFVSLQNTIKSKHKATTGNEVLAPVYTYIKDLVAGRPVLTHPLAVGGFRLRYGKTRTNGYSAASIHPATMHVLSKYIAVGTQLKVERPGKACTLTCCDSIEGPIVKLKNGDVVFLDTELKAKQHARDVVEIIFLGDILFSYGDFFNRAHTLVPPGYCEEWWGREVESALNKKYGKIDIEKLSSDSNEDSQQLTNIIKNPIQTKLPFSLALALTKLLDVPIHPAYTYHWKTISKEQLKSMALWIKDGQLEITEGKFKLILPLLEEPKRTLEILGIPHSVAQNEFVIVRSDECAALVHSLNMLDDNWYEKLLIALESKSPLEALHAVSGTIIRDKSGVFIGARMGRPEKAKMRKLTGSPHVLFPVGEEGGRLRSFQSAMGEGIIEGEFPNHFCTSCNHSTVLGVCEKCNKQTVKLYHCKMCGLIDSESCKIHGKAATFTKQKININSIFDDVLKHINTKVVPDLIKGVKGTMSKDHIPEHPLKGILRAKYDVAVNKDGTTRYDATQLPVTHFTPAEIQTSIEKLHNLGYEKDIYGNELISEEQVIELKPQDLILPACPESPEIGADKSLFAVAQCVDDMLELVYGEEPFYNLKHPYDLVGHLVMVLAPHTSAAIVGRIVGFSQTQGLFAHPMLHAATRRDCDGDEASVSLLLEGLLNFSRQFLPNTRGATQDAPLVLTSRVVPSEVDDMLFDVDVAWSYPLEFYEACVLYKKPWEVKIEKVGKRINTPLQYEGYGITHPTSSMNAGVLCSAYKILPSMEEKLKGQMDIADRIRAVDAADVARLVIEKHLIRDIRGNLRKFSTQEFRCVKCNEKFRRPPLAGKCSECQGKIIFTVSEGSVIKYLEPAISLAAKYKLPPYLQQSLSLTKDRVEETFGKEKEKQEGLGRWFG